VPPRHVFASAALGERHIGNAHRLGKVRIGWDPQPDLAAL
jgi:hypothetical protein